jgi:ABC-type branched-subunit amino acid transport system ATPase component/branched-subunit amino acid ABC-type transport system permease component
MTELINLVVSGLVTGALYAMLASALTLTYTTSGMFNFGQGGVAFATAYLFFQLNTGQHVPAVPAAAVSILLFAPLLGWVLHRFLFRGLREAPIAARLVATLGLLIVLPAATLGLVDLLKASLGWKLPSTEMVFGTPGLGPNPPEIWRPSEGLTINSNQVAMLIAGVLCAGGLWFIVRHTRLGLEMRAAVSRPGLAALRGVDPDRSSAVSWIISCVIAGLSGVLLAPLFTLAPASYNVLIFVAIPAVVLGRMRSIPIVFTGALGLGVVQNLVAGYTDLASTISGFTTAVPFIILFGLLFFFGGERGRRAGTMAEERPPMDHLAGVSPLRRRLPWAVTVLLMAIFVLFFASDFWSGLMARGLAATLVMLSFTVVTGIGGMVSLAQSTFVITGGFTTGILMSHGWLFVPAAIAATLAAALVGLIVALPTGRLGGLPLALATLALAYLGENLIFQIDGVSNGSDGWTVPRPVLGPIDTGDTRVLFVVLLALVGLVMLLIRNLVGSASGRAMLAVRSTEPGAMTMGVAAGRVKLAVFAISAAIAGFGGVMLSTVSGRITNLDYPVLLGLVWLATAVTFGIRRPAGAFLAGMGSAVLPQLLAPVTGSPYVLQILFGLGAINLAKNSDGLLAMMAEGRLRKRHRREQRPDEGARARVSEPVRPLTDDLAGDEPGVALRLSAVRAGYGGVEVLHGVDLVVPRGAAVGLLGGNGAGKTTLCSVVGGLVPVTGGRIEVGGVDVTHQASHLRSSKLFLAPEGRGIFPDLTVEENLSIWLRGDAERTAAYDAFPVLGTRRRQPAGALSGGEQQMLSLAPALVHPPDLLVADEPSLGLAPVIVDRIFEALRDLHQRGTALLIAEEKTRDVLALADHVVSISVGSVNWAGPTADTSEDLLAQAYLGFAPTDAHSEGPVPSPQQSA